MVNTWIKTYNGKRFDVLNPNPDLIDIEDIAHALSNQCRYGGHSRKFYSVAEHSIHVSNLCILSSSKLGGLLHDASEAYLVDIPRPIKHSSFLLGYRDLERRVQDAINLKFNVTIYPEVKHWDDQILRDEVYQLMNDPEDYGFEKPNLMYAVACWSPREAKEKFLARFNKLRS